MSASMLKYLIAADSLCDGENGVSLTALALKAGVTKVSAYRAVDRLETDGYLRAKAKRKSCLPKRALTVCAHICARFTFCGTRLCRYASCPETSPTTRR